MSRPLLLDLFCGAGGASVGYHDAGFDVVGIDIEPQPNYPFTFHQEDAVEWLARHLGELDDVTAIHASPPCQRYSTSTASTGDPDGHPDLIEPIRDLLEMSGKPYVIENVEAAPLRRDLVLCGSMFDLRVRRHRVFELGNWMLWGAPPCRHVEQRRSGPVVDVTGHAGGRNQTLRDGYPIKFYDLEHAREVMGMPWASTRGCTEAIPPAYTEFIGRQLIDQLDKEAAA